MLQRILGIIVALSPTIAHPRAPELKPDSRTEVTIKGNVLCNRATDSKDWFWDPKDGDHTPIIYALGGSPETAGEVQKIMEGYPDHGLDVDSALEIQDQFTRLLKYFISPGPLTEKIHKDVEAGSRLLALTGTISEQDGKKWITITGYQP